MGNSSNCDKRHQISIVEFRITNALLKRKAFYYSSRLRQPHNHRFTKLSLRNYVKNNITDGKIISEPLYVSAGYPRGKVSLYFFMYFVTKSIRNAGGRERERELNIVSRYSGKFLFERTFSIFDWLRDDFNLSVIFPVSVSRNDSIGEFT